MNRREFLQYSTIGICLLSIPKQVKNVVAKGVDNSVGVGCLPAMLSMSLTSNMSHNTGTYILHMNKDNPTGVALNTFSGKETTFIEYIKRIFTK